MAFLAFGNPMHSRRPDIALFLDRPLDGPAFCPETVWFSILADANRGFEQ
jgi:hypothetical protein